MPLIFKTFNMSMIISCAVGLSMNIFMNIFITLGSDKLVKKAKTRCVEDKTITEPVNSFTITMLAMSSKHLFNVHCQ